MNNFIEDDYARSERLLASKGKSFYWARFFLIKKYAIRTTRLYGFCRYIDDIADDATSIEDANNLLAKIINDLNLGNSDDPYVIDAIKLFKECKIDINIPSELIAGVLSDLKLVRIENEAQLLRYCFRVAGTVGLMMCAALDVHSQDANYHAIDLGIAMQLTNIARDIKEDASNNRRYIPSKLLENIDPILLVNPDIITKKKASKAIQKILLLAEKYYYSGNNGLSFLPLGARISIYIASHIYRKIGHKIKENSYDVWSTRAFITTKTKAIISTYILFLLPFKNFFWKLVYEHDKKLHIHLKSLPCTHTSD
jgi:15-cis-phytoene synthase